MSVDLERIRRSAYPHIQKFNTYIDIGALDGDTSTALVKDFERVICFEPNPYTFEQLSEDVEKYNVALSDTETTTDLILPNGRNIPGHASISRFKKGGFWENEGKNPYVIKDVAVKTLDSYNFTDVSFIKIDTEGSEFQIIQGGMQTIKEYKPVMFYEVKQKDQQPTTDLIRSLGLDYKFKVAEGGNMVAYV